MKALIGSNEITITDGSLIRKLLSDSVEMEVN